MEVRQYRPTQTELQSQAWVNLLTHLNERLERLRIQNDNPTTPDETAHTRGQIAEVKRLIALAEPMPDIRIEPV